MSSKPLQLPQNWSLFCSETSAGVYRVAAVADDGRRIEATATEPELGRVTSEVVESAFFSDRQIAERHGRVQ